MMEDHVTNGYIGKGFEKLSIGGHRHYMYAGLCVKGY
jgi:hypothetical protein